MDSIENIITLLKDPIKNSHNFREIAEDYARISDEFEKKVYNAPLVGCGAGLLMFSGALGSGKTPEYIVPFLLPSIWLFFLGVIFCVLAGVYYISNLTHWKEEKIFQGNGQATFLDIYEYVTRSGIRGQNFKYESFTDPIKKQINSIVDATSEAKKHSLNGDRALSFARLLIFSSGIFFVLGVLVPLIGLSINSTWKY